MTMIPLREYIRDIENLVEAGKTTYAEQHCRHVLGSFPKHVELYRLLGKSCLDTEKIDEAGDVFQRVLSVIPDDYAALAGLGFIKEEQDDLDSAIFYMEKAGEVNPGNQQIKTEIRRLYFKRDCVEQERDKITPAGLILTYLRSNLHDQAIAKARISLTDNPGQVDLLLLLARAYYLSGNRMEAGETAIQVVKLLPYCLEANKILFIICSSINRTAEANTFRQRINDIDPYSAFVSRQYPSSNLVPDHAIMLERLDTPLKADELHPGNEPAAELIRILSSPVSAVPDYEYPETPSVEAEETKEPLLFLDETAEPAISLEAFAPSFADSGDDEQKAGLPADISENENSANQPAYNSNDLPDWLRAFSKKAEKTGHSAPQENSNSLDAFSNPEELAETLSFEMLRDEVTGGVPIENDCVCQDDDEPQEPGITKKDAETQPD